MKNRVTYLLKKATITITALAIVIFFNTGTVKGQYVSTYAFTQAAGAYTAIAGTTVLAAADDDTESVLTDIGFTFNYHCVNYTQFSASPNGYITLGTVGSATGTALSSEINCIAFAAGDGKTNTAVTYLLSGTAPNRILTIQYPSWYVYYSSTTETLSAQIKLYETTNVIKIIYGPSAHTTSYTRQAGITGAAVTDFSARTTTTNWSASTAATANTETMTWSSTIFPANGLTYTWTPPAACAGIPAPGNTVSTINPVCSGIPFTLSMSNSLGCGITYQWQSSADNVSWTNIAGATAATYAGSQTAATYYRCLVTCANGGATAYSTTLYETMNSPTGCYCASNATSTSDMDITKIIFGTINNTSAEVSLAGSQGTATGTAGMYSNWRGTTVPIPSFTQGSTNTFSVTINNAGATAYSHCIVVYIDFNQDGDFTDGNESFTVFAYANPTMPNTTTYNITIPLSAATGITAMRIVCVESSTANPCGTYTWGETEDYNINITAAPLCSGTPTGGTTAASTLAGCTGYSGAISVTGSSVATGLTYQWYSSPTGAAPWTLIPGATGDTYTPTTYGLYYRRQVTCTSSGNSAYSSSLLYNSASPANDNCVNATTLTVDATQTCTTVVSGTVACSSASPETNACSVTADDDVWFKFVATSDIQIVTLSAAAGSTTDMYHAVYSGTCGSLTSLICNDGDQSTVSGLIVGQTYYVRVWTYTTTTGQTTTFNLCVGSIPPPAVQAPCTNLGFESGFTGWYATAGGSDDGPAGTNSPTYVPVLFNNTTTTQTTLMTAGTDPYGGFPTVFNGSQSVRISNSSTSETYSAGSIQQTFLVDATNTEFTYSYAAVLQDGGSGHTDNVQPYFSISVYDQTGAEISCGMYLMTAPGVGYILATGYTDVYYKPWSTVSVNLSPYIGQTVTIKAKASDCAWEAHFGYVYLDCSCSAFGIINPAVICAGQPATLTAPAGAASYSWTPGGQTTQSITVSPGVTTNYTCNMTTSGITPCPVILTTTVTVNAAGSVTASSNSPVCPGNPLNLTSLPAGALSYSWTGPNGFISNLQNPIIASPTAAATGNYTVTTSFTGGCSGSASVAVTVSPNLTVTASSNTPVCQGSALNLTSTPAGGTTYAWTGPGSYTSALQNPSIAAATPAASGTYTVTVTNASGCSGSNTTTVTINPTSTITLTSAAATAAQTLCVNTALTNITYATTSATGATVTGLPAGVTGSWAANVFTISGTPTATGTFNYTITTSGGCGVATATGTITVNPANTIALTSAAATAAQTLCINTALTNITYATTGATGATVTGLPAGVTGSWAANVFTISGTPTASGTFSYTVTTSGGCGVATATGTLTVNPANTITLTSAAATAAQTLCINALLTNITYATTGATGATVTGLPAGVTGSWAANVFTISGTPTASGTFSYTITTSGGCGVATATGTITVNPANTITLTSAAGTNAQSICINTPLTNITYATTGATGATVSGLPAGVTGSWAANVFTISGTPTASGTFSYTITTSGGCGTATATGTINVVTANTITLTSAAATAAQTLCINTALTNITYATTGATGATVTGLPAGVTGNWAANVFTISGTPTATGTFSYTITTTGGCGVATATGTITVNPASTITLTSAAATAAQTLCVNTALTNITYATTSATGATVTGLPAGVTGSWAANVFTISGTPTATGTFNYTITTSGGCGVATATGTITVNPANTIALTSAAATAAQTLCINTALTNITYATTGATGATVTGLPAGVTGSWAANVFTISGTPTASGTFSYTVTTSGGCGVATATGTITVNPANTITLTSAAATAAQTLCINALLTNITYATTGATGATVTGLPAGVTGSWAANVFTISGTPTASGTFSYTVTTSGGCGVATATGTITVNPANTITLTSAAGTNAQSICINTPLTNITYATTGATGATVTGLPAGVTGSWAANVFTISGTPTASGTFSYTITTSGGCGTATATGTINVVTANTITLTSAAATAAQTLCINTALTNITYATTGATGATVTGLPAGVTGNWAANVFTISGTPTATGTFSYTITTTGGCGVATATGTITVNPASTITLTSAAATAAQTLCINTALNNITYATTSATGATVTGLPAGVTGSWAANVFTISGTPTATGTFTYTITTSGGCGVATATGTITVNPANTIALTSAAATAAQTLCINTALTNITYATTNATGATVTGLPAGVTGSWAANVFTISGTPTASGTFSYTVTTSGGCGVATATGTITVNPANTITLTSAAATAAQTLCINALLTNITYATTGATGATVTGLPAGVTGSWAANVFTISGTPTASGTFSYTITTSGGCGVATATGTITVNPTDNPAFNYSPSTLCITGTDTPATITGGASGTFSAPAGLLILNAATGLIDVSASTLGTYTVTFNTSGVCPSSSTASVTITTAPDATISYGGPYCLYSTDPAPTFGAGANAGVFSSTAGLIINGSTGLVDLSASTAGTYTITNSIVASGGCAATSATASITINPTPTVIIPANFSACNGASVPATTLTGTPAVTVSFAWTNSNTAIGLAASGTGSVPAFTATNSGTAPITATITVTPSANGCTGAAQSFVITINPTPTVTVPAAITVCNGSAVATTSFSSPTAGASYAWTNDNTTINLGANGTGNIAGFNATNSGTNAVTATITVTPSANTCAGTPSTYTITVNPTPNVTVPANITVCSGAPIAAATFTSATAGASFAWSNNNTAIGLAGSGNGNTPGFTAANGTASPITATITVTPSANTCTGPVATYSITVNPSPTVNVPANITVCNNALVPSSVFSSTTPGASFAWTNTNTAIGLGASGTGIITSFTAANTSTAPISATITVTPSANTCTGTASSYTITVNPSPVATVPANVSLCTGATVPTATFTSATTGTGFTWTNSNASIGLAASGSGNTIPSFTASNTGTTPVVSTITVTPTANTCTGTSASYTITVNPLPQITFPAIPAICVNAPATTLSGATPAGGAYSGTGVTGSSFNPLTSGAGTFVITYTYTSANGCTNASTQNLTVNPQPTVAISPQNPTICLGTSVSLTATGASTYTWSPTTGLNPATGNIVSASPIANTIYVVTGTANGCTNTANVTVNVYTSIPISVSPATPSICPGESAIITATGGITYTWSPPATLSSSTGASVTATPATTTTYNVVGSDLGGCTGSTNVVVTINPLANISFLANPKEGCAPLSVDFLFVPAPGIMDGSWLWNFGDNNSTSTDTAANHIYNDNGTFVVALTAQTVDGCDVSAHDTIVVYPVPVAEFIAHPDVVTTENPTVNFIDNSTNTSQWDWTFGDPASDEMNNSSITNPSHSYMISGEYTVVLIVSNEYGCTDTATKVITVHDAFAFWIPNAFSPNEDLVNDYFAPQGVGYKEDTYVMRIFDRWGKTLYYTEDITKGWNGNDYNSGMIQPDGVYSYQILITDESNHKHDYVGSVILLK